MKITDRKDSEKGKFTAIICKKLLESGDPNNRSKNGK